MGLNSGMQSWYTIFYSLYSKSSMKSSMDNPTYDENISVTPNTSRTISDKDDERVFQNPIFSDVGHNSAKNSNPHHPYEDIKTDTPVSTSHENVHGSGALGNEELQSSNEVNIVGDGCYSALDHGTEYSTLEPHVPKPYQEQLQPSTDDYSQLHHK